MQYLLSNRQRTELFVRRHPLQLALPVPPQELADPLAWSISVLPADVAALVTNAEEQDIFVRAVRTNLNKQPDCLAHHLGTIVRDPGPEDFVQCVVVVVVSLTPPNPNSRPQPPAWPLAVKFRDQVLPGKIFQESVS